MTEAGEKWARKLSDHPDYPFGVTINDEADFWLRAFCDEVEKKAVQAALPSTPSYGEYEDAFFDVKRKLLGDWHHAQTR